MGLFSRKPQNPDDVALPLPELEEPEPATEEDADDASEPPRVLKVEPASGDDELDPLALTGDAGSVSASSPQARPAAKDDVLSVFEDVNYTDPVVEHLLSRVQDVRAEDLLLEARDLRLRLKGALPADPGG